MEVQARVPHSCHTSVGVPAPGSHRGKFLSFRTLCHESSMQTAHSVLCVRRQRPAQRQILSVFSLTGAHANQSLPMKNEVYVTRRGDGSKYKYNKTSMTSEKR